MTTRSRKTTPARPRKETVADESPAVVEAQTDGVEEPAAAVAAEPAPSNDVLALGVAEEDKGRCDNHPDRAAVLDVDLPWIDGVQRFCAQCVPTQYRYLMP